MGQTSRISTKVQVALVFVILLSSIGIYSLWSYYQAGGEFEYNITHRVTVWITPLNHTFELHISIYLDELDVGDTEKSLLRTALTITPSDDVEHAVFLINLPKDTDTFWVELYVNQSTRVSASIEIGFKKTIMLAGSPIEILIVPMEVGTLRCSKSILVTMTDTL